MTISMPTQSIIDTRRHQMFPALEPAEIERVRRFGKVRSYGAGEALAKVGEVGPGMTVILTGMTRRATANRSSLTARARSWAN
jgi:thioredoxin reductase (NADPH)